MRDNDEEKKSGKKFYVLREKTHICLPKEVRVHFFITEVTFFYLWNFMYSDRQPLHTLIGILYVNKEIIFIVISFNFFLSSALDDKKVEMKQYWLGSYVVKVEREGRHLL